MKITEVVGTSPLKQQLNTVKRQEKALKVQKAQIKSQQAQQQLRKLRSPANPV